MYTYRIRGGASSLLPSESASTSRLRGVSGDQSLPLSDSSSRSGISSPPSSSDSSHKRVEADVFFVLCVCVCVSEAG